MDANHQNTTEPDLKNPDLYINRELSFLQFNMRVLALAKNHTIPLFERLRFLFICSSNLDEYFEVRVAGIKHQLTYGHKKRTPDGLTAEEALLKISQQTHEHVNEIYRVLNEELLPALEKNDIVIVGAAQWSTKQAAWIKRYFREEVLPLISPVGLDLAHPFPRLVNKSLNYIVSLTGKDAFGRDSGLAIVHAPASLPRIIRLPEEVCEKGENYVFLNAIISAYATELFGGMTVTDCYQFRITRNSDLFLDEENIKDLAIALKSELFSRRYGMAVRLEIAAECPDKIAQFLLEQHGLSHDDLYRVHGPVNLGRFRKILELTDHPELRYETFVPGLPQELINKQDIFEVIRRGDLLLHHPYQAFFPVLEFIRQATLSPEVLSIKQTLYRLEADSPMANALIDAARAGKQVTAVIELRARFDEEVNLQYAARLQEAGALVVYGVVGFKTHAKMTLVVRREGKALQRYAHVGTGNYHAYTAKHYTDFGLFTQDRDFTQDIHEIFQQLTGMGRASRLRLLLQSPFTLEKTLLQLIDYERQCAEAGKPARIIAKMNALTDSHVIRALYVASQAGVKIDLIVRGVCCLRPGIAGISHNIKVHSIIGRFLEHSRVYYFHQEGNGKIYCSSADWMERNLAHRVEVCFPITDSALAARVKEEALLNYLADNVDSWELKSDGTYKQTERNKHHSHCAQEILLAKYRG